jgi:hypothetical protein
MTADINYMFSEKQEGFAIGDSLNGRFFKTIHQGDLDFHFQTLEIGNTIVEVFGDTLNSREIIKRFDISELIVHGSTLNITNPIVETVSIYPNPAESYFFVAGTNLSTITVSDIQGRTLIKQQAIELNKIPIRMQAGLYFVLITDANGGNWVKKLIVK